MKKRFIVHLVRTEYFNASVEVLADSAEEAEELADASDVEDWGGPVDVDIEVAEGCDAVECLDDNP